MLFHELNISEAVSKAIHDMGFIEPSPIQKEAIPLLLDGHNVFGQAQTGTGKTAAFGIPMVEKIEDKRTTQGLVLVPTRELAIQVSGELQRIAQYKKWMVILPIYGGQSIERQIRSLSRGIHIVVGTPGRVLDHIARGTLHLDKVSFCTLDEADVMLDMGFIDDVREILSRIPPSAQKALFSATLSPQIKALIQDFVDNPRFVTIPHKELTVPNISQFYYEVRESEKPQALTRVIDYYNPNQTVVFVNTKIRVEELKEKLHAAGYEVEALHGDMKQTQREFVMKRFRAQHFDILLATDVAARGLDIENIDLVVNYDLPQDEEYYVHRIGRTARAGREGTAVTFVTLREIKRLKDIERYIKTKIERKRLPSLEDIEKIQTRAVLDEIATVIEEGGLEKYLDILSEGLSEYESPEIAAALLKMLMGETEQKETPSFDSPQTVRLFLTLGRESIDIRNLLAWISDNTGIRSQELGRITMRESFSFVDVPRERLDDFLAGLDRKKYKGKTVRVEIAREKEK
ncbi:DEAD/DEAH box helicase [Thermospira aquatica]|uniref:RNA helicase n=1 Tax=Thermospira aquatica TaxID=2828656 RepID=A0AAX3BFI9_9SPIR|nr:DEAD/DEAH box helicase [Thermospira aquatica]URA11113.1 DEAD/DEAH box helicase [Thermospira aquatica]